MSHLQICLPLYRSDQIRFAVINSLIKAFAGGASSLAGGQTSDRRPAAKLGMHTTVSSIFGVAFGIRKIDFLLWLMFYHSRIRIDESPL